MPSNLGADKPMANNATGRHMSERAVPSQVRAAREAAGVSIATLARRANLSSATIRRVESGRRAAPATISKIAAALTDLAPGRGVSGIGHTSPRARGRLANATDSADFMASAAKIGVESPRLTPLEIRSMEPVRDLRLLRRESRLGGKLSGHLVRLTDEEHRARSERARRFLERPMTASAQEEYSTVARHVGGKYGS